MLFEELHYLLEQEKITFVIIHNSSAADEGTTQTIFQAFSKF